MRLKRSTRAGFGASLESFRPVRDNIITRFAKTLTEPTNQGSIGRDIT
jgi:hypothetical protein